MKPIQDTLVRLLRTSERYTKTDMVYLAGGGFWLVLGQAGAALTAFIFSLVVANYLPPHIYGSYKYLLSLAAIIAAFSLTGLSTTVVRAVARGDDYALVRGYRTALYTSIPMLIGFFGVSGYYLIQGDLQFGIGLLIAGVASFFINGSTLFNAYLNGKRDFGRMTLFWTIVNTGATTATIVALLLTHEIMILVGTYFIASALGTFAMYVLTANGMRTRAPVSQDTGDALHLSIMNFLNTVSANIDKIIVFQFLGTVQLALYSFALAFPEQLRAVFKAGARLAFPRFAAQELESIRTSLSGKILRFGVLIAGLVFLYIIAAPFLFLAVFPVYKEAVPYSQMIALTLFGVLGTAPLTALQAHLQHRLLYTHAIITNCIQIVSSLVLIGFYGLWGAVWSLLLNRTLALIVPWVLLTMTKKPSPDHAP